MAPIFVSITTIFAQFLGFLALHDSPYTGGVRLEPSRLQPGP